MKFHKVLPWLPALLVLGGCPGKPPEPTKTPRLAAVSVSCAPNPVTVGGTSTCTASATDEDGQAFSVSGYTWSSSDAAVAKVDAQGVATSVAPGTATLSASATADGVTQQGAFALTVNARPPTVHTSPITQNETWRTADNPHLVRGQLTVDSGATLTLEPGADVRFEPDAELRVRDGALQAAGTAQAGIQLSANGSTTPGAWRGVVLATNKSVSRWSFVTLRSCGQATGEKACLTLLNQAAPVLQDVTVSGSGGVGVKVADDGSAFGAGSARLTVTGSAGYAVSLGANQASTLPPASTFTGNTPNAIALSGNVTRTQTWPTAGVPYVFNNPTRVISPDEATNTTLTLSPGTVLRFGSNASFVVGRHYEYQKPGVSATLVAEGTAAAPILFTADSDQPGPGSWRGVHFTNYSKSSRLSQVTIEYAGGIPSDDLSDADAYLNGNLNIYDQFSPIEVLTVSNVILRKGKGPGFHMDGGALASGSSRLTVRDSGENAMQVAPQSVFSVPTDTVFENNASNKVLIESFGGGGNVLSNTTWHKLSVPYYIDNFIDVTNGATLTLEPGTEFRFAQTGTIRIGFSDQKPGVLIAKGTAAAPIRFVKDDPTASYYWGGLHFWYADGSQLDHLFVSTGGGMNKSSEYDPGLGVYGDGCINFYREIGPVLTNSTFERANGAAIRVSRGTRPNTTKVDTQYFDPQYNNTSTGSGYDGQLTTN